LQQLQSPAGPSNALAGARKRSSLSSLLPRRQGGRSLDNQPEEMTMSSGGVPTTNASSGSSGTSQLLSQLSTAEQQALSDMISIQENQIQFNDKMNDAQTAKQVSQQFAIHG
jgi:hypothetical protein